MQIVVHIPDDMVEATKDGLPPPSLGILEAVALDAILAYFDKLSQEQPPTPKDG
jgi:hypothetical protein